jgi:oligoendopeptidase F
MATKQKTREEINNTFKWDTSTLYKTQEEWQKDYDEVVLKIKGFDEFKGKLNQRESLLKCIKLSENISKIGSKVYIYSNLKLHEDTSVSLYQGMSDKADNLTTRFSSAISFIAPEMIAMDESYLQDLINNDDDFKIYKHYILDLLREKKHILNAQIEEVLAKASDISSSPETIFSMISNADMKFGNVKDEKGNDIELTQAKYISLMESTKVSVRKEVFNTFYDSYISQKNTLAATYNASVKANVFYSSIRNFNSSLEQSLSKDNIPKEVYTNLIETVHKHLPSMHEYIKKRKAILQVDELHMYDLYTPIVPDMDTTITYDYAKETVLKSLKPLGAEYVNKVQEAFSSGWVDVYPNKGKRSGAYSWGCYGNYPFVLLNFDNKIGDMFTLAHEMGHAMQSYYTWEVQPYVYSDYTIFVAEVASTVNETLLMTHLKETTTDETHKKYLINYFLEQFRGTIFRQTMFAEFEMITHEMVEKGEPLTVESLNKLYRELNIKYYGDEIVVDEKIEIEWARIPHFYNAFYVYQYATGFASAIALATDISNSKNVDKYLNFLKAGSSDYSINLLKGAGVDMSSPEPINKALKIFEKLVQEL